jgi:hypothetical protein
LKARPLPVYPRRVPARVDSGTRQLPDCSRRFVPAQDWLGGQGADARGNAERRAEDLVRGNRGLLADFHVEAEVGRVRGEPGLHLKTGARVGALPLRSPVSGRVDFGLMIRPRFPWSGVGDLLATTGFRVVPELLPLPEMPQSERRIPPWVLASVVLQRLERLLDASARRFTTAEADRSAPHGQVDWTLYATRRLPVGQALRVPCRYPDLRDDEQLRAAVHWAVRRHRESLLAAPAGGRVVRDLIAVCERLIVRLAGTPPLPPDARQRAAWRRLPFVPRVFSEGLQAIDWTVDERGLAGLSELAGLSWRLNMEVFFEAWVEALAARVASRVGAVVRSGRQEQTRVPLDWEPAWAGSQRSLLPDVVLARDDVVVVLDAKYKQHAADIDRLGWSQVGETLRQRHRADLLQALAYSTLYDAPRVVALLVYPCGVERWRELNARKRVLLRARARVSPRTVEIGLLSVPLGGSTEGIERTLETVVRTPVA